MGLRGPRERRARCPQSVWGVRGVAERTSTLKLLGDVASAANNAENLKEALEYTLRRTGEQHGRCFGQAYFREERDSDLLTMVRPFYETPSGRFRRFRAATRRTPLRAGQGLPGSALATGTVQWADDISEELVARRAGVGRELGVRCGAAFPIFAGHEVAGVLEFFSDAQIEQTDELLVSLGRSGS